MRRSRLCGGGGARLRRVRAGADPGARGALPERRGVTFDALRADALGVYGSTAGASPRIDAWVEGAVVFENAWSVTPVTPTSVASLLSGRPPLEVFRDWRFDPKGSLAPLFAFTGHDTGAFLHDPQLVKERGSSRSSISRLFLAISSWALAMAASAS